MAVNSTISENTTWAGGIISADTHWNFVNGATISFGEPIEGRDGSIVVSSGVTLTLSGFGGFSRLSGNTKPLVYVESGGTLIVMGNSSEEPFVFDGNNHITQSPAIHSLGDVTLSFAIIQNNKNRASAATGGGLLCLGDGSLTMTNTIIRNNTSAQNGGGMFAGVIVTATDCEISGNVAGTSSDVSPNKGRGGGFWMQTATGSKFTRVDVSNNKALYYGGGGQLCSDASLEFIDSKMNNNIVYLGGAGGLHLTGNASFAMTSGQINNNVSVTFGGGIHTSYQCGLALNGGEISGNVAYSRGGGIHVNTGGDLLLNGTNIRNNQVTGENKPDSCTVSESGDVITVTSSSAQLEPYGYGGGILVDAGTFTMNDGEVSGNKATYGGGITLASITSGDNAHALMVKIPYLEVNDGSITGNEASMHGGAVYLMKNSFIGKTISDLEWNEDKATHLAELQSSRPYVKIKNGMISQNTSDHFGGAIYQEDGTDFQFEKGNLSNNVSNVNGGAVYLTDGVFEMKGGSLSNNTAGNDGGAVYIVNGDISILSGNITSNACTYNGGAFYVADGNVSIGVEGCLYENGNDYHTVSGYTEMTHPIIQYNNANRGGSIYLSSANGFVYHHCGTMTDNYAYDTGRNLYLKDGTFNYYAGQIGTDFDTGIEIENGSFEDLSQEAQEKIVKELIYHSSLVPYTEDDEVRVNAGIPDTKWINAPNAVDLLLEDVDLDSPTWGELFPEYTFVSWYSEENEKSIDLYADWVGSSMSLFKIQQNQSGSSRPNILPLL